MELREIGVKGGTKNVDKWRPDQAVERVILEDRDFTFLYDDGASAVLMDPHTFEQAAVDKAAFGEAAIFLKVGTGRRNRAVTGYWVWLGFAG